MKLNVITGLPRSGSTLLCNILNQNDANWASSTSNLPAMVSGLINLWSSSPEIKGDLARDRQGTEARITNAAQVFCRTWHQEHSTKVVFDKSRGWNVNILTFKQLFPDGKAIVTIRDLRNVFASIEKQHQKFPLFDEATNPQLKTIQGRAESMFSPAGLVGGCITGIEDMINRKLDVLWVKYERLTEHPEFTMQAIYDHLGEAPFKHNFKDVKNTATDLDALYLNKYPHEGGGEVRQSPRDEWSKYMSDNLAALIMGRFQLYNKFFNYT